MAFSGKIFILVFVMVAAVAFVGSIAYVTGHSNAQDVTISNTSTYHDEESQINQTVNQSLLYGQTLTQANIPMPLLLAILVLFGGLGVFLVIKK